MNLYLATRHLLSLLESPLTPERFEAQMQANPLFTSGCMRPQRFLFFLADEGILATQGLHVQLTTTGLWPLSRYSRSVAKPGRTAAEKNQSL
jgi:hypothetical protein